MPQFNRVKFPADYPFTCWRIFKIVTTLTTLPPFYTHIYLYCNYKLQYNKDIMIEREGGRREEEGGGGSLRD